MPMRDWSQPRYDDSLGPWACRGDASRGRLHQEGPHPGTSLFNQSPFDRSPFQRDRDRVIHSGAFRKLLHKTQVFVLPDGDYYRNRLSHTLEVAQISRTLARALHVNEDLAEAVALTHDLGHTPFGHSGEEALNHCLSGLGGFDHNDQTLRLLTQLETRYATFDGLNLTWESIEGAAKHNGPLTPLPPGRSLPLTTAQIDRRWGLALDDWPGIEAQIAAISDDIAYNSADLEDGLRAKLFTVDDLAELPILGHIVRTVLDLHGKDLEIRRLTNEVRRRLINNYVENVLQESRQRIEDADVQSPDDVRRLGRQIVSLNEESRIQDREIRRFLWQNMYLHYSVVRRKLQAKRIVTDLFELFRAEPEALPNRWQERYRRAAEAEVPAAAQARVVADYVAGMTDRYAVTTHKSLFNYYDHTL